MRRYSDAPFNNEDMQRLPYGGGVQQPQVYQIQQERRKYRKLADKPFSIVSASKYILMLSLMLYWLPLVGQMIAGFVGGRRAGSPWRAICAALLPVAVLFLISQALQYGIIPIRIQEAGVLLYGAVKAALDRLPVASVYVNFATSYISSFVNELSAAASFKAGNYLLTIAFAYIGGIISAQTKRELEYVSRYGAPTTNILVSPNNASAPQVAPVMERPGAFARMLKSAFTPQRPKARNFASFVPLKPVVYGRGGRAEGSTVASPVPEHFRSEEDAYVTRPKPNTTFIPPSPPPVVVRHGNTAQQERARRFVERALGKDYLADAQKQYKTYMVGNSYLARKAAAAIQENEHGEARKNDWELL
ncbi:MAG: hypothetical protein QXP70_04570 [Methanomassiliicoccales archaeon]